MMGGREGVTGHDAALLHLPLAACDAAPRVQGSHSGSSHCIFSRTGSSSSQLINKHVCLPLKRAGRR